MNERRHALSTLMLLSCLVLGMSGCVHHESKPGTTQDSGPKNSPEQGMEIISDNAKAKRDAWKDKTFEEFKAQAYKEPFEGGKYIVNGDTAIVDEKHLQEFFETRIKQEFQPTASGQWPGCCLE